MLTVTPGLRGHAAASPLSPQDSCLVLEVDRTQELLSLCAQAAHPLVLSGAWVHQQCGTSSLEGSLTACAWGRGQITVHLGEARLSWHEGQVFRTLWRRWREPLGLRHGLLLWDTQETLALSVCAPLRSSHCEGALWRSWMAWIADLPLVPSHPQIA